MKRARTTRDKLTGDVMIAVKHSINTEQPSYLWCDKIELINNHLMFYTNKKLIFKIWLKKGYKDIHEALKDTEMLIQSCTETNTD